MKLGEVIVAWRKLNRTSIRQLAKDIGIDHSTLHRLESGHDIGSRPMALIWCWLLEK